MDYTRTSLADVRAGLSRLARDTHGTFGTLDAVQLSWRPDDSRWSAAQCLQHLVAANDLMMQAADRALDQSVPKTMWQRLPILPRLIGPMMIRSQAPTTTRRFVAPAQARPSTSDIGLDIVQRFVMQHDAAVKRLETLDERQAARTIMVSPFVAFITYSVLDGWRLMFAHDLRHLQQARGVLQHQKSAKAGRGEMAAPQVQSGAER
jgi:hypothetical protein